MRETSKISKAAPKTLNKIETQKQQNLMREETKKITASKY